MADLPQAAKEDLALALLLLRDFKRDGCRPGTDDELINVKNTLELAKRLGVSDELSKLMSQLPPMKITPR